MKESCCADYVGMGFNVDEVGNDNLNIEKGVLQMNEKILAVSAGHEITEQELNDLIANYPPEQQIYLSSPQAKDELLEQLIGFHLFSKLAEEKKIKESQEFKETLAKMENELASHMAATGIMNQVTVAEKEVKAYFDANPAQFASKEQVKAKHILVDEEAMAQKIAGELEEGKAFEEAAREYSTCPSKENGGDLGYFGRGQMVPEFDKVVFSESLNEVHGPIKTQFGYHLILIENRTDASVVSYEEAKPQVQYSVINDKREAAYKAKVEELEKRFCS